MNLISAIIVLAFAAVASAAPQNYYGSMRLYGYRYGRQNRLTTQGQPQTMTPEQRAQYLPVMKALLTVLETDTPTTTDINKLMILTRELTSQIPKNENLLTSIGGFGLDGLETIGLPEAGDIVIDVGGVPHIKTEYGIFPLSDTSLMTNEERAQFLPAVRQFASILEKDYVDQNEINALLAESKVLSKLIPGVLEFIPAEFKGPLDSIIGA